MRRSEREASGIQQHEASPSGLLARNNCRTTPARCAPSAILMPIKDLKITSKECEAFLDDFQQTLDKFKVPTAEQAELKAIIDTTRADIVADA